MMKLKLNKDDSPSLENATTLDSGGNDSIRRKNRMSIESVNGSIESGDKSKEYELRVSDNLNGRPEKPSFLSPNMSAIVNSQSIIESTIKKSDERTDASYDFYQKVISSPLPGGSSLLSPTVTASIATTSLVPVLTKQGYTISPSLDSLSKMSEGDLAAVSNFIVSRESYGSVAWEGAVDVRGIDLDSVVEIEAQSVAVYNLEEMKGTKPPIGSKLNRPAIITIHNIFPPKEAETSSDLKQKFVRKISSITKKNEAELLSYDVETGDWRFRVFHFSRYGLRDDDSDEEGVIDTVRPLTPYQAPKIYQSIGYEKTKVVTRFSIDDDLSDDERALPMFDSVDLSLKDETLVLRNAEDAYKLLQSESFLAERFIDTNQNERKFVLHNFGDEGYHGMDFVRPVKSFRYCVPFSHHSISAKIGRRCGLLQVTSSKTDFGLRMGKSFRVGWRPDGSLVSTYFKNQTVGVTSFRPRFSDSEENRALNTQIIEVLSTLLTHSTRRPKQNFFSLPESSEKSFSIALKSIVDNLSHFKDSSQDVTHLAFLLLLIISQWDEVDISRKCHALMSWYEQASCYGTNGTIDTRKPSTLSESMAQIYTYMCNNDTRKAQSLADGINNLQLSALITNSSVQASFDVKAQRDLWCTQGALTFVTPALSSLYALRSGDVASEKDVMQYAKNSRSDPRLWRRCMGMLLFRKDILDETVPDSLIRSLLSKYRRALDKENVPLPIACHERPRCGQQAELCLLYKLLMLLSKENICLMDVISPRGHTQHHHDYLHSFFLTCAISSIDGLPCATAEEGLLLCDNMATKLINIGLWEWAVYVYLYQFEHETLSLSKRLERAKDVVTRFFDGSSVSKRFFLHHDLGVPDCWLEESLSYRSQYHFSAEGNATMS